MARGALACVQETTVTSLPTVSVQTKPPKRQPAHASVSAAALLTPLPTPGGPEMLAAAAVCGSVRKPLRTLGRSPASGREPRTLNPA